MANMTLDLSAFSLSSSSSSSSAYPLLRLRSVLQYSSQNGRVILSFPSSCPSCRSELSNDHHQVNPSTGGSSSSTSSSPNSSNKQLLFNTAAASNYQYSSSITTRPAPPTHAATAVAGLDASLYINNPYAIDGSSAAAAALQTVALPPLDKPSPPGHHVGYDVGKMQEWIETIKGMFQSMKLGEITISAYDTAWVAMVPSLDDSSKPQFPQCLGWILKNQLLDGSWGDKEIFLAYDRVCSTLACVIALKTWSMGQCNIDKGLKFIRGNIANMEAEANDYMPIGFEVVFPALLDDAKELGLDLPYDAHALNKIKDQREKKLKRIPMEVLHNYPTTLLHSLEGLHKIVDWNQLLKLQAKNGSFLFSPASTACALKYTGDKKCLQYLELVLSKFIDAVPNVYPVDMFEHLWVVDRLERLGVSRYFKKEIRQCLDYVYRYWTKDGISWASESNVYDVDDTAMGFRLLRLHAYDVSADVFKRFKKDNQFFCFEGQTSQAITGMYNLYRASYTMIPGETILQEAQIFTQSFLDAKRRKNQIQDKWIIARGLQGEVEYALNYPWHASLPRIETRSYIDHYGVDDVWIGKSLYRMPIVNNEAFLNLAKADFNLCQKIHQKEIMELQRWYKDCQFDKLIFARQKLVECYFSAAATMFEPELAPARLVWTRCSVLTTIIDDFFDVKGSLKELTEFLIAIKRWDPRLIGAFSQDMKILFMGLYNTMNAINQEAFVAQGRDISSHLQKDWVRWITNIWVESKWTQTHYTPSMSEYMEVATPSIALEPILQPTLFFIGERISDKTIKHKDYAYMMDLVNKVGRLNNDIQGYKRETSQGKISCINIYLKDNPKSTPQEAIIYFKDMIKSTMTLLMEEYLRDTELPTSCKKIHLNLARIMNFFYRRTDGFSSLTEMVQHVNSILYNKVL
uniref:Ent-kaurene synthase n=1 Tax=Lygodium japonicum TaxID=13824 RepID=A0A0B6VHX6_LYGJA|nr:ent-kaurene synthase [Lygodium japonicum]